MHTDRPTEYEIALETQGCAFAYPDDAPRPEQLTREDLQAALLEFIRQLTDGTPALLAGQRLHLLAFLTGVTDCRTQRELAERLNVSPGRVTQILQALPSELRAVAVLRRRTAKRHDHYRECYQKPN